jgi:hypothetical protein
LSEKRLLQVRATEPSALLLIKNPEHILTLKAAYDTLQQHKIRFLQSIPHYKFCTHSALQKLSGHLRRRLCQPKEVLGASGPLVCHTPLFAHPVWRCPRRSSFAAARLPDREDCPCCLLRRQRIKGRPRRWCSSASRASCRSRLGPARCRCWAPATASGIGGCVTRSNFIWSTYLLPPVVLAAL